MSVAESIDSGTIELDDLVALTRHAVDAVDRLYNTARVCVAERVSENGKVSSKLLEHSQHVAHGLSWLATYVETLRQASRYAENLQSQGHLGELEKAEQRLAVLDKECFFGCREFDKLERAIEEYRKNNPS